MNNFVDYFYKMDINNIKYHDKYYSFIYKGYAYRLYLLDDNIDVNYMLNINKRLIGHTLTSEIIINKDHEYISSYGDKNYMLIKVFVSENKNITLDEINYLANSLYAYNLEINYGMLWSKKIDYLEDFINENGKKYPIMVDSFNYFVGMAENAISYFNNIVIPKDYRYVISHKSIRWDDSLEALYNPLNIIFDYQARDISEYIKIAFFLDDTSILTKLNNYLHINPLSLTDVKILIARLLYPSFYFQMYEDILVYGMNEKIIMLVVDKLPKYEEYLGTIIDFFRGKYDISDIPWLKKRSISLH